MAAEDSSSGYFPPSHLPHSPRTSPFSGTMSSMTRPGLFIASLDWTDQMGKSREEDGVRGVSRATQVHDFQMVSYAEAWRHMVSRGVGGAREGGSEQGVRCFSSEPLMFVCDPQEPCP